MAGNLNVPATEESNLVASKAELEKTQETTLETEERATLENRR